MPVKPRCWFEFRNVVQNKTAEIFILDEIGGWGVSAKQFIAQLRAIGEKTRVKLHIFSGGGDVLEGNEIYNALREHPGGVDVEIGALAASIASVVAMAGETIKMAENGLIMIHNPWTIALGDSDEMRKVAEIMDKMKKTIIAAYARKTGLPENRLSAMMDEEKWLDADEALEHKFIDGVMDPDEEEAKARDALPLGRFRNAVQALSRVQSEVSTPEPSTPPSTSGNAPGNAPQHPTKPETVPPKAKKSNQPTLLQNYMSGRVRIFNSILAASISSLGMRFFDPHDDANGGGADDEATKKIREEANRLYQAKLKRDTEIDEIVLSVRKRDKRDFGKLAGKFKREDKTPDEFARAVATSDEFDPFEVVGAGSNDEDVLILQRGSPGEAFVQSEVYKRIADRIRNQKKERAQFAVETPWFRNATPTTTTGLTSIEKQPGVLVLGVRPLTIKDLLAPGTTSNTTIRYIQEQAYPGGAPTTVAEGAAKPEVTFTLEEKDAAVRKIAAWTKVTDELFADYPAVSSYINERMPYLLQRVEEDQLLDGDGVGQNLLGILNQTGVQTQAKGTDTVPDAIYKAFTKVRWGNLAGSAQGGFEPDGIVIHPTDWEAIRLLKDSNGQYFGGGPFTGAYGNSGLVQFDTLWGKPVVITPAITENTALVGAFRLGAQYFMRQGLTVESTNTDQDDFIKNLMTLRIEERLALAVYRPSAFCQVTGI